MCSLYFLCLHKDIGLSFILSLDHLSFYVYFFILYKKVFGIQAMLWAMSGSPPTMFRYLSIPIYSLLFLFSFYQAPFSLLLNVQGIILNHILFPFYIYSSSNLTFQILLYELKLVFSLDFSTSLLLPILTCHQPTRCHQLDISKPWTNMSKVFVSTLWCGLLLPSEMRRQQLHS